jgi:NADH:ubiquinone oxidoreductase subunit K
MIHVAILFGALGVASILYRRSALGVLIGVQILFLGATLAFVRAGLSATSAVEGHIFGFFILTGTISVVTTFLALAVRLFFLRGKADLSELKTIRN